MTEEHFIKPVKKLLNIKDEKLWMTLLKTSRN
jgi:hypothetical protein